MHQTSLIMPFSNSPHSVRFGPARIGGIFHLDVRIRERLRVPRRVVDASPPLRRLHDLRQLVDDRGLRGRVLVLVEAGRFPERGDVPVDQRRRVRPSFSRSMTSTRGCSCAIWSWFCDSHGSEFALLMSFGQISVGPPPVPVAPATPVSGDARRRRAPRPAAPPAAPPRPAACHRAPRRRSCRAARRARAPVVPARPSRCRRSRSRFRPHPRRCSQPRPPGRYCPRRPPRSAASAAAAPAFPL